MANTADNQEERDDVAAAPTAAVGEGAMMRLFMASGGPNVEKVNIDEAVRLGILDETKAAVTWASGIEDDFTRTLAAEKASRKPTFEAFKAAFTAVYGKLRFEKPAASEKAVKITKTEYQEGDDGTLQKREVVKGERPSPLVAVMARVLKNHDGLSGEGASFEGRPELRVMACAMDDMMLEREAAVSRIPGLEAAMENARYDLQQAKDRAAAIDKTREAATQLTDGDFERGVPGKFREAYKGLWGKRFIAAELGAKKEKSRAVVKKLKTEVAKYWANLGSLRDDFVKLRDLADANGEAKLKDELEGIVKSLNVYIKEKDEAKAADLGQFLERDVAGASEKIKGTSMAQREEFRKLRKGGEDLKKNLLIVSRHHTLHDAIDAQAGLDQEKVDAEAALDAYMKQVGPVKSDLNSFLVQARIKKNSEVADVTKNALSRLTDLTAKIKKDPTGWEQFLSEELKKVVAVLEENDVGAKQTIAKFGSQVDGLIGGAKVVEDFHEAESAIRKNAGILADQSIIEGEMDEYAAELDAVKSGLSTIVAAARTSGERPVLADAALKKVEAFLENLGTDERGWKEFVEDELPEAIAELGGYQSVLTTEFLGARDMSKKLSDERGTLSNYHAARGRWENFSTRFEAAQKVVGDRYDVLNGEGREELLNNVFAVSRRAQTFTSRVLKIAVPELVELCEEYVGKSRKLRDRLKVVDEKKDEYVTTEDLLEFGDETTAQFLTEFKRRFAALDDAAKAEVARAEGAKELLDTELEVARNLAEQEDPQRKVLQAVFPGMKIGDDGEISVHGFRGSTGRVMERFDGKKDGAGNVVEVGALPWFADSKNLGGVEKDMAELDGLMEKLGSASFLAFLNTIGINPDPGRVGVRSNVNIGANVNIGGKPTREAILQSLPDISILKNRVAEKIQSLRSRHIADPEPKLVEAHVKTLEIQFNSDKRERVSVLDKEFKALADDDPQKAAKRQELDAANAEQFDKGKATDDYLAPYEKRRDDQAKQIGQLENVLGTLKRIEELTAKLEPKCKELVAHLSVGNTADVLGKAGLKFKKVGGADAQFAEVEAAAGALDAGKPETFLAFYKMFDGHFKDENNVDALVGEYKRVRASILEMTSKESPETAKKVVAEMLAQQGVPPEQINNVATAIIRDGVGIIATKKKWEQIAKECQPKVLENLQALAFRDKISKFKVKKGEKESTPFASLKPENFADQAATEQTLRNLERMKGADWLLEYGFIIMAAFKVFEGNSQVDASGQGVAIEKYLKNMLAEKWLDKHPEFDSVDKAMMDSDFVKLINEEFDKRFERGAARFGEFSDAYDASAQGMKMKLALKIDRDIKVLKAKRKAKTIGKKEYDEQFTALLEQAEEEGVRGMLKEVSPRWKVSTAAAMSGFWNNDFMLGVRGVRENVADWLKAKSKALGATTVGGVVKGGVEFMKRMGIGSIVGGVMAPIGVVRWTGSFLKNLVLGRWTFGSTRAMIMGDLGTAKNYVSGGVGQAVTDSMAHIKGMWEKVRDTKADDAKAKRKEKGEEKLKLAESDSEALKGKTELDAVEVPAEPDKDIVSFFEKKHAALAERKKPASMRQERPRGEQERLAA